MADAHRSETRAFPGLLDRRRALKAGALSLGGLAALTTGLLPGAPRVLAQESAAPKKAPRKRPDPLEPADVKAFVGAAHGDLGAVREMLAAQPALVNATWDWGGGDWETALGGASHMGEPEIARHLLAHGARMDVFCAAMLGEIEVVRAYLAADPEIVHVPGPHGIPLRAHAKAGGQEEVEKLLRGAGAA